VKQSILQSLLNIRGESLRILRRWSRNFSDRMTTCKVFAVSELSLPDRGLCSKIETHCTRRPAVVVHVWSAMHELEAGMLPTRWNSVIAGLGPLCGGFQHVDKHTIYSCLQILTLRKAIICVSRLAQVMARRKPKILTSIGHV
jgi:hypothetical protein